MLEFLKRTETQHVFFFFFFGKRGTVENVFFETHSSVSAWPKHPARRTAFSLLPQVETDEDPAEKLGEEAAFVFFCCFFPPVFFFGCFFFVCFFVFQYFSIVFCFLVLFFFIGVCVFPVCF